MCQYAVTLTVASGETTRSIGVCLIGGLSRILRVSLGCPAPRCSHPRAPLLPHSTPVPQNFLWEEDPVQQSLRSDSAVFWASPGLSTSQPILSPSFCLDPHSQPLHGHPWAARPILQPPRPGPGQTAISMVFRRGEYFLIEGPGWRTQLYRYRCWQLGGVEGDMEIDGGMGKGDLL